MRRMGSSFSAPGWGTCTALPHASCHLSFFLPPPLPYGPPLHPPNYPRHTRTPSRRPAAVGRGASSVEAVTQRRRFGQSVEFWSGGAMEVFDEMSVRAQGPCWTACFLQQADH